MTLSGRCSDFGSVDAELDDGVDGNANDASPFILVFESSDARCELGTLVFGFCIGRIAPSFWLIFSLEL
jgi:hypothetical protein